PGRFSAGAMTPGSRTGAGLCGLCPSRNASGSSLTPTRPKRPVCRSAPSCSGSPISSRRRGGEMSLRDWPIRQKLTAMLVLSSGLVLLLTSAALVGYQYWSFRQTMRSTLSVRGSILATNSTASLAFANDADARELLSAVIAVAVLTVALLAAYLLSRVLQGAISQPVLMLAETARAVSDRRDYSVRAAKLGEDELGVLTDAFNHMLSRIEAQDRALRESKEGLEQRVTERTHELEERN